MKENPKNFPRSIHGREWLDFSIVKEFVQGLPFEEGRKVYIFKLKATAVRD